MGLAVTFQVNLETDNLYNSKQPYSISTLENWRATRLAYFPDINIDNYDRKDGNTFTANDAAAMYLIQNYTTYTLPATSGTTAPVRTNPTGTVVDQPLLSVISYTLT